MAMVRVKMIAMAAAMVAAATPAAATITYQFVATSTTVGAFGRFTVNVPSAVTVDTVFSVDDLNFCEVTSNPTYVCRDPVFSPSIGTGSGPADQVQFNFNTGVGGDGGSFYYFAAGTFGMIPAPGAAATFSSILLGDEQAATLTIFNNNDPGPPGIPEPASWAMLIAGFGLVGAAARRRRLTLA
jgi:hypothetical protein